MDHTGLTRPVHVDPTGVAGPTPGQARGPRYRSTSRGLFVPASVSDDTPKQRILEAATAVPHGAVTGWAALRWLGGTWFGGLGRAGERRPVAISCRHKHLAQPGLRISQEGWCPESDVLQVDGVRVTTAARSVYFEMRFASSLVEAVIALDMACFSDLVSIDELDEFVRNHGPRTGVGRARLAVALADENSWSPQETATRLYWLRADLPPLACNRPLFDLEGQLLGTPDLMEPVAGVVVEYDGAVHLRTSQRRHDRNREEAFRDVGLEYVVVMAGDLAAESTTRRFRAAHARASASSGRPRGWTLEPPTWWIPTESVAARRALDKSARERLLRYRHAG